MTTERSSFFLSNAGPLHSPHYTKKNLSPLWAMVCVCVCEVCMRPSEIIQEDRTGDATAGHLTVTMDLRLVIHVLWVRPPGTALGLAQIFCTAK